MHFSLQAQGFVGEEMASTVSFNLKINPRLLDIVDKEWKQDNLADDGGLQVQCKVWYMNKMQPR